MLSALTPRAPARLHRDCAVAILFPGDTPHPERSGLFLHLNRGKRSVEIDAGTEQGATFVCSLAADADLVIEAYAPGDAARWGWGYDALKALNPAIVLASVTPFGQTGPYRDYRGSELTLQALARSLTISIDNNLACFPRVDLVPVIRHGQAWPRRYRHTSVRPNIADAITIVVRVDRWL